MATKPTIDQYSTTVKGQKPATGSAPPAGVKFTTANDARAYYQTGTYKKVDQSGYNQAMIDYMRQSPQYANWSDDDIANFVSQTSGASQAKTAATELWYDSRAAYNQAKTDAAADRAEMLKQIGNFNQTANQINTSNKAAINQYQTDSASSIQDFLASILANNASTGLTVNSQLTSARDKALAELALGVQSLEGTKGSTLNELSAARNDTMAALQAALAFTGNSGERVLERLASDRENWIRGTPSWTEDIKRLGESIMGGIDRARGETMAGFKDSATNLTEARNLAAKDLQQARAAAAALFQDAKNNMLKELQSYAQSIDNSRVKEAAAREAGNWRGRNESILARVQQQFANMGRSINPLLLGDLQRRLTAQAADAVQRTRLESELQMDKSRQFFLDTSISAQNDLAAKMVASGTQFSDMYINMLSDAEKQRLNIYKEAAGSQIAFADMQGKYGMQTMDMILRSGAEENRLREAYAKIAADSLNLQTTEYNDLVAQLANSNAQYSGLYANTATELERQRGDLAGKLATTQGQFAANLGDATMGLNQQSNTAIAQAAQLQADAQAKTLAAKFNLTATQAANAQAYLGMLGNVYGNTDRQVMDPVSAAKLIAEMGKSSASTGVVKSGGGGGAGFSTHEHTKTKAPGASTPPKQQASKDTLDALAQMAGWGSGAAARAAGAI